MTTLQKIGTYITLMLVLTACNSQQNDKNREESITFLDSIDANVSVEKSKSDSLDCNLAIVGGFKTGKNRFDLIIVVNGWNPNSYECTYAFGELMSNEFPPDSSIKDFRIHLIDNVKFDQKIDSAQFNAKISQHNLIATERIWPGEEFSKCKFDPNKTGKYHKPAQWLD